MYIHGLLERSVPHPKIIGGVRTPATPPVAERLIPLIIVLDNCRCMWVTPNARATCKTRGCPVLPGRGGTLQLSPGPGPRWDAAPAWLGGPHTNVHGELSVLFCVLCYLMYGKIHLLQSEKRRGVSVM